MSIRLSKVTRDLNVGMSTLVEFLQKKGHVVENNPNTKITEEEYEMLVTAFSQDMTLKKQAEQLVQERLNRERQRAAETAPMAESAPAPAPVETPAPTPSPASTPPPVAEQEEDRLADLRPHLKQVGKI